MLRSLHRFLTYYLSSIVYHTSFPSHPSSYFHPLLYFLSLYPAPYHSTLLPISLILPLTSILCFTPYHHSILLHTTPPCFLFPSSSLSFPSSSPFSVSLSTPPSPTCTPSHSPFLSPTQRTCSFWTPSRKCSYGSDRVPLKRRTRRDLHSPRTLYSKYVCIVRELLCVEADYVSGSVCVRNCVRESVLRICVLLWMCEITMSVRVSVGTITICSVPLPTMCM